MHHRSIRQTGAYLWSSSDPCDAEKPQAPARFAELGALLYYRLGLGGLAVANDNVEAEIKVPIFPEFNPGRVSSGIFGSGLEATTDRP